MTREMAYFMLTKYLKNPILLQHCLATEATMRALAEKFNGDKEIWGMTGLLHDADYELSKGQPNKHGTLLFKYEPNSIPSVVEHAIRAHNFENTHVKPESILDWALYCCDELTGFIAAVASETPEKKLAGVNVLMIVGKLKDKEYIKGLKRDSIFLSVEKLGIPFEEFIGITLRSMQGIHEKLGL